MKKLTIDDVSRRSVEIHGSIYSFVDSVYVNNSTPILIGCLRCDDKFWMRPFNHLNNRSGCPKCARAAACLTFDEFVRRGREQYGDKIDYSEASTTFFGSTKKVLLICVACSHRWMSIPAQHMSGRSGCPTCANDRRGTNRLTTEQYISKCVHVYGDTIDYSRVVYVDQTQKVELGCRTCGNWFWMNANCHLYGKQSCPNHRYERVRAALAWTFDDFVRRSHEVHGQIYDYPPQCYVNSQTHVTIVCRRCAHVFKQTPVSHVQGQGCPRCAGNIKLTTQEIIERSVTLFGTTLFDLSRVDYDGMNKKIEIGCRVCANWYWQTPLAHLHKRHGCPKCASVRFVSLKETAWLDTLNVPDDTRHRQVLISGTRFKVDALVDRVIFEFYGTYYHGDPRFYSRDVINVKSKNRTMGELYDRTLERQSELESLGYAVRFVWEPDYDRGLLFSENHPTYGA